jgi:hypothetical protein
MQPISNLRLAKKNQLLKGYAAFNDDDRATLEQLLCEDVIWHPMDGGPPITGREAVLDLLHELRVNGTEAELFGVASHDDASITLDFTTGGPEGDHACADKIEFDESGCIREVWHCSAGTHQHGTHAGHPSHDHYSS